jgi:hypothetical protein
VGFGNYEVRSSVENRQRVERDGQLYRHDPPRAAGEAPWKR